MVETRRGTEASQKVVEPAGVHDIGVTAGHGHTLPGSQASGGSFAQLYTTLMLALACAAVPLIVLPKMASKVMFGSAAHPMDDQLVFLLQINASAVLAAAAAAFALREASLHNMLHTFTADGMKLALAVFAAGNLLLQFYYPATLTAAGSLLAAVGNAAVLALPTAQLLSRQDASRVARSFQNAPRLVSGFFTMRRPAVRAALYALLAASFPLAGASYFFAPKFTLYHTFGYVYGRASQFLWKMAGLADMTIMTALAATLKEKAEGKQLDRPVSRALNFGLGIAAIIHLLVLGPILSMGHGGFILPVLVTTWGTALMASMIGLASPGLANLVEQTAEAAKTE